MARLHTYVEHDIHVATVLKFKFYLDPSLASYFGIITLLIYFAL